MARYHGTTTQRGYGYDHVCERNRQLALWRPGQPCARCGRPMWQRWRVAKDGRRVSAIDLGHTADRTGYTGLEHVRCNRGEGAARGNRQRGQAKRWAAARRW
jgi:hypothetical protein